MADDAMVMQQVDLSVEEPDLSDEEILHRKGKIVKGLVDVIMSLRSEVPLNHLIPLPIIALAVVLKTLGATGVITETEHGEVQKRITELVGEAFESVDVDVIRGKLH